MILPYTLDACPHSFSVCRLEAMLLRSEDCIRFHTAVAPSGYPGLLLFVKVDTSNTTTALIRLWTPKFAIVLKLLVEEDCSRPTLFKLASFGLEGSENLNAVSIPHHHPLFHAVVPNDMPPAVFIQRNSCAVGIVLRPIHLHALAQAPLVHCPRPHRFLLPLVATFSPGASDLVCQGTKDSTGKRCATPTIIHRRQACSERQG
mmetsp:Transcript_97614/g.173863  ORF Transcript_97614/g.173863 Transcript_97614/m.173863 type:complete len:203 (-) Transcript_97614:225-833(-)